MKKKLEKKIVLNRETLRRLEGDELGRVIGGVPPETDSCVGTCTCRCGG
ncbi:MAG TPA: class I lanthipeptide [Thermoanaerobaculia bacterium]|nr:class I lanthipeptide [Thermoanaerobaculia bacterium]